MCILRSATVNLWYWCSIKPITVFNTFQICTISYGAKRLIRVFLIVLLYSKTNRDTAGQERFRTLTTGTYLLFEVRIMHWTKYLLYEWCIETAYYRGAMGILLMYDVTSLESYNNLSYWLRNIQEVSARNQISVYEK